MSTLEEMAQTYVAAFFGEKDDGSWTASEDVMRGLLAVLEKHVGPTIRQAQDTLCDVAQLIDGARSDWDDWSEWDQQTRDKITATQTALAQLTKQNEPAKHEA